MLEEIIAGGASALGISLPENAPALYREYLGALMAANRDFNLTAIGTEEEAARLHILDSLGLLKAGDMAGKTVIDVGTGGGLPGLAIAIARPTAGVTLLDATEKKIGFLADFARKAGIGVRCVAARAEELGREPEYRERFDAAVSRAVARLNILAELCLPFVRVGGVFLAMKAADSDAETAQARGAVEALGGELRDVVEYEIPGTGITRRVAVIEKRAPTPERYPRRWAAMQKKPL